MTRHSALWKEFGEGRGESLRACARIAPAY